MRRRSPWAEGATCSACCACEAAGKAGQAEDPPHLPAPQTTFHRVFFSSNLLSIPSCSILPTLTSVSCCTQLLPPAWLCLDKLLCQNCVAAARSADPPLVQVNTINTEEKGRRRLTEGKCQLSGILLDSSDGFEEDFFLETTSQGAL